MCGDNKGIMCYDSEWHHSDSRKNNSWFTQTIVGLQPANHGRSSEQFIRLLTRMSASGKMHTHTHMQTYTDNTHVYTDNTRMHTHTHIHTRYWLLFKKFCHLSVFSRHCCLGTVVVLRQGVSMFLECSWTLFVVLAAPWPTYLSINMLRTQEHSIIHSPGYLSPGSFL